ncbi:hypothetical protein B0H16DRAFT_1636654 [Mycena metata]|uniref:Uncharacterized protein n=1 Tax=Mycena metata TaxID=1033252 RepID=A0AAD7M861_9AGAR|nr:hypothetical protein B0H16DRAFT_1636654 [Mycena metata]
MNPLLARPLARRARSRKAKSRGVLCAAKRCPRPRPCGCRRRGQWEREPGLGGIRRLRAPRYDAGGARASVNDSRGRNPHRPHKQCFPRCPVLLHRPRTPLRAREMLVIVVGSPGPSPACFCSKHATRPATYDSPADDHARHPSPPRDVLRAAKRPRLDHEHEHADGEREDSEEYVELVGSGTPRYDAGGDRASTRPGPLAPHRATRPEQDDAAPRARA